MRTFYSNISKRGPKTFHLRYLLSQIADKWSAKNSGTHIVLKEQRCSSVMSHRNQSKRERGKVMIAEHASAPACPVERSIESAAAAECPKPSQIITETHTHQQISGPKSLAPSYTLTAPIHHLSQSSRLLLPLSPSLPLHPQTSYLMWMLPSMAKTICSSTKLKSARHPALTSTQVATGERQADLSRRASENTSQEAMKLRRPTV